jgi:Tol biopolymer transport system component
MLTLLAALLDPGSVTTSQNEYNYSESADGSTRLFARAPKGFKGAKILVSRRTAEGWSAPEPIPFSDSRFTDSDPFLAADGKTLYFVSDRLPPGQAEKHDLDIWRARLSNGAWQAPEHLAAVSSPQEELGVELIGDTLYFNSSRKGGPGPLSIYGARVADDSFDAPEPLPAPINSPGQQGDFTLSPDGRIAMFWSQRDKQPAALYAVARAGQGWGVPQRMAPPIAPAAGFTFTPSFSPDGTTLFFASMWKEPAATDPLFNGEANLYRVPARLVYEALGLAR